MCRGKFVGSFGIPPPANMVGAVGGYDVLCSNVTIGQWRELNLGSTVVK